MKKLSKWAVFGPSITRVHIGAFLGPTEIARALKWLLQIFGDESTMLENNSSRNKRRVIILEGISQDLGHSEIRAQLGASRWLLKSDIKYMQRNDDLGLRLAKDDQAQIREKKVLLLSEGKMHFKQNKRFRSMTGITLQEKSFRNMIDFNKHDLLQILRSKDQNAAIFKLSKSIQKTLKRNGIITKRWHDNEITGRAQDYLTDKNPVHEL